MVSNKKTLEEQNKQLINNIKNLESKGLFPSLGPMPDGLINTPPLPGLFEMMSSLTNLVDKNPDLVKAYINDKNQDKVTEYDKTELIRLLLVMNKDLAYGFKELTNKMLEVLKHNINIKTKGE